MVTRFRFENESLTLGWHSPKHKKGAALLDRPSWQLTLLEGERCALVGGANAESNDFTVSLKNRLTLLFPSAFNHFEFSSPIRRRFGRVSRGDRQRGVD